MAQNSAGLSRPPILYDDGLKAAPLEPTSRQIRIAVYCPKLTDLPNETVEERIDRLKNAVHRAANDHAQVFLGPEYPFTKDTRNLARPVAGAKHCYSGAEFLQVTNAIVELGVRYPTTLLIPGTTLWKNQSNEVRNTGYVSHHVEGGGVEVLADGAGDGRIERPFEMTPKTQPTDDSRIVKTIEVRKAVTGDQPQAWGAVGHA